jgi:hypothetical protein
MISTRDIAFSAVINQTTKEHCKTPEICARYCDHLLKKSKDMSGAEVDDKFTKFMAIFNYLEDKDVFENWHWILPAKGLMFHSESQISMLNRCVETILQQNFGEC